MSQEPIVGAPRLLAHQANLNILVRGQVHDPARAVAARLPRPLQQRQHLRRLQFVPFAPRLHPFRQGTAPRQQRVQFPMGRRKQSLIRERGLDVVEAGHFLQVAKGFAIEQAQRRFHGPQHGGEVSVAGGVRRGHVHLQRGAVVQQSSGRAFGRGVHLRLKRRRPQVGVNVAGEVLFDF